jgi:signal transduction histidine kinase
VLAAVHQQAAHLRQIVEALLFLARADAEAHQPAGVKVAVAGWLAGHLHSWCEHARAEDIRVVGEADANLYVLAQPALLGQLVDILLENACKYSPPGSPITLWLGRKRGEVALAVADQGCGIAEKDLPYVCEPFFRSPDVRSNGVAGVGLGLAIAKRLAEAFGGRLTVTSEPGRGSRFIVLLPEAAPAHEPESGTVA